MPYEPARTERRHCRSDLAIRHAEKYDGGIGSIGAPAEGTTHRYAGGSQGAGERLAHAPASDDVAETFRQFGWVQSRHDVRVQVRRCGEAGI
jgi:hypothetical protein